MAEESVTEEWRAVGLFTDRGPDIRRFMEYIQAEAPPDRILYVLGDGGHGKTLLLRYLRDHCCKRFGARAWTGLQQLDDDAFKGRVSDPSEIDGKWVDVPACMIDFNAAGAGYNPQDGYDVLLKLHRELAPHGLHFPLYDIALIHYLRKSRQASAEHIKSLLPETELSFVAELASVVGHAIPFYGLFRAAAGVAGKHVRPKVDAYLRQRNLSRQRLDEIARMDPERDLVPRLPALFGEDLNVVMALKQAPPRLVLFFDTHEAFWGQEHLDPGERFFQRDEWLRRLLLPLVEHPSGVLVVVAGRDVPRWSDARICPIPVSAIDFHALEGLSDHYARAYLQQPGMGITDAALQQSLLECAWFGPNEVHPLHLSLGADIVLAARAKGVQLRASEFAAVPDLATKNRDLLSLLLRWVDDDLATGVRALSVCRSFNRKIYFALGAELNFPASRATFEALARLSFVRSAQQQGAGWHRFHDLLRRLIREQDPQIAQEANVVMERYYRERADGDAAAMAEAIYHANRLDWQRGLEEWEAAMTAARRRSDYDVCRALYGIRRHLIIESDFWRGIVENSVGAYLAALAQYAAAQASYGAAIAAYDAALTLAPDRVEILSNKGLVLQGRGDLEVRLARHGAAQASYTAAITAYDAALARAPDHIFALSNKGNALQRRGDLEAQLAQHAAAQASYSAAIAAYDAALALAPDRVEILSNTGLVLQRRGDLEVQLARHGAAQASYSAAITAYDAALTLAPDDVRALNNKGLVLQSRGELEVQLAEHAAAQASYSAAIAAYDAALTLAPDRVEILSNKGLALASRGDLEVQLAQHEAAQASYSAAITAYDAALVLAPDYINALSNKGLALASRGDLEVHLARHGAAQASYSVAIAAYDAALALAPDHVTALNNKGTALRRWGDLDAALGDHVGVCGHSQAAVGAWTRSLEIAPGQEDVRAARDAVRRSIDTTCSGRSS